MSANPFLTGQYPAIAPDGDSAPAELSTLDRLARLAARLLRSPIALVSSASATTQRFVASVGLPAPLSSGCETPLTQSICQFAISSGRTLAVVDAQHDPLVRENPAVAQLGLASYLGTPLRAKDGRVIGSFCVADRTPRVWSDDERATLEDLAQAVCAEMDSQAAYAALAEATAGYRGLLDTTTELVCAADGEGVITYVNQAWCDAFGFEKGHAVGTRAVDLVTPEHRSRFVDVARRLHAGERVDALEVVALGRDGRRVVCRGNATAICVAGPAGEPVCIGTRAVYRDVTQERLAHSARARLVATLEATSDFVGIAAADGSIEYINTAGRRLIGIGEEANLTALTANHFHPPATLELLQREGFPRALRDGVWRGDGELIGVDGALIPVSIAMTAHPSLSPEEPGFFAAIMRDQRAAVAAAAALQSSETRFRAMFESAAVGVSVVNEHGILIQVNRAFEQMLGYLPGELTGRYAPDLSPSEEADVSRAPVAALHAGIEQNVTIEKRFYTSTGDIRTFALTISRLPLEDGSAAIIGLATDISGRLEAEQHLARERAFLSATLESLSDGVVACDADGKLVLFNKATRALHGVPEQSVGPEAWTETYSLFRADGVTPLPVSEIPLYRVLGGERVSDAEMVIAPRGGTSRVVLASGQPLLAPDGTVQGAVVAMRDVTEARRAELALRESEDRYRRLIDLLPDGIIKHTAGRIEFANVAMARLVGVANASELEGTALLDLVHADDHALVLSQATAAIEDAVVARPVEERIMRRDGTEVICEVVGTPVRAKGRTGMLSVVRDISERRQSEQALREREIQLAAIYNHVSDAMFFMRVERDAAGGITGYRCESVNAPLLAVTGKPASAFVGRSLQEIAEPQRYATLRGRYDDAARTGQSQRFELITDGVNGSVVFETTLTPVRDALGRCTHVVGANRDVTARRAAEAALQQSEAGFRTMLQTLRAVAVNLDAQGCVTFVNDALLNLTGWKREEVVGRDWFGRFTPAPEVMRRLFEGMIGGSDFIPHYENELLTRGGRRRLIVWDNTVLRDSAGRITGTASIGQDVTEQRAMEAQLAAISIHDELTSLLNRRGFVGRVEDALRRARRTKSSDALLYIDMDRFKPINDTYGHAAGDDALRAMSELLRSTIRDTDVAGRLGGDEFAVYAAGLETLEDATALANRLQQAVATHNAEASLQGRPYSIGFSIGIAWALPDDSRDTLFARADEALYAVKHERRREVEK